MEVKNIMPRSKVLLPEVGTPEWEKLVADYTAMNPDDINILAKHLGYKYSFHFVQSMKRRGVMRKQRTGTMPSWDESQLLPDLEQEVLKMVKSKPLTVGEISRRIDRSKDTVEKILESLQSQHYNVALDKITRLVDIPYTPSKEFAPTEFNYFSKRYRIGLVSDTHLGSKYQQLSLLHDAYAHFDELDVDAIFHAGDIVDGVDMYRGQHQELFLHNAEEQRKYAEENYPRSKKHGLKTYIIGGNHDYSFYKQNGYDIVEHICEHRDDMVYRGWFNAQFNFKGVEVGLRHPSGGVAYARSYHIQKHIENLTGFIQSTKGAPPALMIFGHWHVPIHLPSYMGVDAISMPCFQAATPAYLIPKGLMPTVGYAVAEIWLNEDENLSATKVEFVNMNDKLMEKDW